MIACTLAVLAGACQSGGDPAVTYATNADDGAASPVTVLNAGCPAGQEGCGCAIDGDRAACGLVDRLNGDYRSCSPGYSTCSDGKWGACEADRENGRTRMLPVVPFATDASVDAGDAGDGGGYSDGGCSPCDPSCVIPPASNPPMTGNGILVNDAGGVTIQPSDGGTPDAGLNCGSGPATTITGTVYDPAGINPLYNATVFVPATATLPVITTGASCDSCSSSLAAKAATTTDAYGNFTLTNVPAGANIPIVVQMGKWRRELILASVPSCTTSPITSLTCASGIAAADCVLRLPRTHTDGWNASTSKWGAADMPQIAMVSGSADPLECMLLKAGIDKSEFSAYGGSTPTRFHFYQSPYSSGSALAASYGASETSSTLESTLSQLEKYDAVLYACEGSDYQRQDSKGNVNTALYQNALKYANEGGRLFLTHYSYSWIENQSTAWPVVDAWKDPADIKGTWLLQPITTLSSGASFPKGVAFKTWLTNIGAFDTSGYLDITDGRNNFNTVTNNVTTWLKDTSSPLRYGQFTFNTPYSATTAGSCGRVVFTDYHASATAQVCSSTTSNGNCKDNTCDSSDDCGYGSSCSGASSGTYTCVEPCTADANCRTSKGYKCTAGSCTRACTKASDCYGGETCTGGTCTGCTKSSNCGGQANANAGAAYCNVPTKGTCSPAKQTAFFPGECLVGQLSPQESALEFMFFDLTSCTTTDSSPPPTPVVVLTSQSFTQTYAGTCPNGYSVRWREVDWQATIPSGTEIDFAAQTGPNATNLTPSAPLSIAAATTSTPTPSWDYAYIDTGMNGSGAFNLASPPINSQTDLVLTMTLVPSTTVAPTLDHWKVSYDCVASQ